MDPEDEISLCQGASPPSGSEIETGDTNPRFRKAFSSSSEDEDVEFVRPIKKQMSVKLSRSNSCLSECPGNCQEQFEKFNMGVQNSLKTYLLGTLKDRTVTLVNHFINQRKLVNDLSLTRILFCGSYFCSGFFSHVTGISTYLIKKALHDSELGLSEYYHGNMGIRRECPKTITFISWMIAYSDLYGQHSPEDVKRILPGYLNKTNLYDIYVNEVEGPHLAYSTFCQYFETYFGPGRKDMHLPCIRLSVYSSHSVCDVCSAITRYINTCTSKEEIEFVRNLKNLHREKYSKVRISIETRTRLSYLYPEEHLTIYTGKRDH